MDGRDKPGHDPPLIPRVWMIPTLRRRIPRPAGLNCAKTPPSRSRSCIASPNPACCFAPAFSSSSADDESAQRRLDLALERDGSGALRQLLREYPLARKPLLGVFGCSPHLSNLAARDPARLARLLLDAPERVVARLLLEIKTFEAPSEAELMRFLRLVKQEAALLVASPICPRPGTQ